MTTALIITLALTFVVGISLGMLGSGGGILLLPLLVYVGGIDPHEAIVITLAVVAVLSAIGAVLHARHGHLHKRAVKLMAVPGLLGAAAGSQLTHLVPDHVLMLIFGLVLLIVGVTMYLRRDREGCGDGCRVQRCMSIGLGVGLLTGFLGVGGGFIIVPSLVLLAGVDMKPAIGASLAIIAINATAGLLVHLTQVHMDWALAGMLLLAALGGLVLGELTGDHMPERALRRVFAALILVVGVTVIALNIPTP